MRKIIKHFGNSNVVVLSKEDCETYNLKEGDTIEFEINKIEDINK